MGSFDSMLRYILFFMSKQKHSGVLHISHLISRKVVFHCAVLPLRKRLASIAIQRAIARGDFVLTEEH